MPSSPFFEPWYIAWALAIGLAGGLLTTGNELLELMFQRTPKRWESRGAILVLTLGLICVAFLIVKFVPHP